MLGLQASAIMTQLLVLFLTEVWKIYFSIFVADFTNKSAACDTEVQQKEVKR